MFNHILEISKRANKGGRVPIKIALLKIHDDPLETNKNGIHWDFKYVKSNMDSAKMMPICCEFTDETKSIPLGHGLTGSSYDENGFETPEFLNSETVGVIESVDIATVMIENTETKVLLGNGYLYSQRYPQLVKWIRQNFALASVYTSVEIMGLESNNNKITYLENKPTEKFRTPVDFVFSGTAILSVQPSDPNAIVVEVAQKNMKEENKLTEQEIMEAVRKAVAETNSAKENVVAKISALNAQLAEKDNIITEFNAAVTDLKKALEDGSTKLETYKAENELLEKELVKTKVKTKLGELDSVLGEFNETECEIAKEDIANLKASINACDKKDELDSFTSEINSIKSKICMSIVEKQKKIAAEAKVTEQNAAKQYDTADIFSEVNTTAFDNKDNDVNIF